MDDDYHMDEDPPLSFVRTTTESLSRELAMRLDVEERIRTRSVSRKIRHLNFEEEDSHSGPSKSADPIIPRKRSCDLSSRATSVHSSVAVIAELLFEQEEQSDNGSSKSAHPRASSVSSLISHDDLTPSRPPKRRRIHSESQPKILNTRLSGNRHLYAFGVPLPPMLRDMDAYEFCIPDSVLDRPRAPKIRLCDQTSVPEREREWAERIGGGALPENSVTTSKSNSKIRPETRVWERPVEAFGVALPDMLLHDYKTSPVDFELPWAFIAIAKAAALRKHFVQTTPVPPSLSFSHYRPGSNFRPYIPATPQPASQTQSQPQTPYNGLVWLYPDGQKWVRYVDAGDAVVPTPAPVPASAPARPISVSVSAAAAASVPVQPRPSAIPTRKLPARAQTPTAFGFPLPAFLLDPSSSADSAPHEHKHEFQIPDFLLTIASLSGIRGHGYGRRTEAFGVPLPEVLFKFQETPSEFALPEEFGVRESGGTGACIS
ncbi:hypothetical protein C8R45DRAFT_1223865 [Mycena sanguinolenta]|nr:hypothetical protein C8R45DRAFT_1223865 [Mycena sanguinolenta]